MFDFFKKLFSTDTETSLNEISLVEQPAGQIEASSGGGDKAAVESDKPAQVTDKVRSSRQRAQQPPQREVLTT